MKLIRTTDKHDYYSDGYRFNIVPKGSMIPEGGYRKASYILAIKCIAQFRDEQEAIKHFMACDHTEYYNPQNYIK